MNSSASGPVPPCTRGHSATYDPDSKSIFVYGGLREGHRYSELYILNTLTWNWKLVTVSCSHVVFKYSQGKGNDSGLYLWIFRQKETFLIWPIIPQPFIRRSSSSLGEFTRAIPLEKNPALILCTSLTQSLNCGTSRSWRGTDLCLGLGPSSLRATIAELSSEAFNFKPCSYP